MDPTTPKPNAPELPAAQPLDDALPQPQEVTSPVPPVVSPRIRAILEIFVFGFLFLVASVVITGLYALVPNLLLISAVSVFLGSLAATAIALKMFHAGRTVLSVGLHWNERTQRNLLLGFGLGALAAAMVTITPVLLGKAAWETTGKPVAWDSLLLFFVLILFGAIGEELLFRGLVFQRLQETFGPVASVVVTSLLFGWAHGGNLSVTWLALLNTVLWGVVFGVACLRSRDLWLPIGLHAAWNWTLPLLGVQLSGFTLEVSATRLHSDDALWAGGAYGPEAGIVCSLAMPLMILFLWRWPRLRSV